MDRITTDTREVDLHGTGRDGFRDGEGFPDDEPTEVDAAFLNAVQEEVARAVELSGEALDPDDYEQLHRAIQKSRSALTITGQIFRVADAAGTIYQLKDICFCPGAGAFGEGHFFAAGFNDGSEAYWSSYDGVNWLRLTDTNVGHLYGVAHGGTGAIGSRRIVMVGDEVGTARPRIATAEDGGGAFTLQSSPVAISGITAGLRSVCWHDRTGQQRWVACGRRSGSTTALIYGTDDGTSWTMATPDASYTGHLTKCISTTPRGGAAGCVIIIGDSGEIQRSTDGITYARVHNDAGLGTLHSIGKLNNGKLIVGTSQANTVLYSGDDGLTWDESTIPDLSAYGLASAVVQLVAAFQDIAVAYMKDGSSDVQMGVLSYDGGATWPEAFRVPTHESTFGQDPWHVPVAAGNDGQRFVLVSNVSSTTAMVFTSLVPNTFRL